MARASINPPKYAWHPGQRAVHKTTFAQHQAALGAKRAANVAPAAPAAPAPAPDWTPLAAPVDQTYLGQEESLRNQRDQAIAAQRQARDATLLGYGYSGTFDPNTDALTGLTLDPTNAFSKAALLKRSYDISRSGAAQRMGATGGLYQGSFQNQQDLINRGQLQAEDALQTSLVSWLANNTAAIGRARAAYETGVSQAAGEAADRAANLQNPNYYPTAPDTTAPTAPAPPVVSPPRATGGIGQPTTRTRRPPRPANQAVGRGTTNRPRVVTHTHSVHTP